MTTLTPTTSSSNSDKTLQSTLLDWLKPRRSVAITRLKNNGFVLVVVLLVTQLAPVVPSATTCLWALSTGGKGLGYVLRWLCWIELAVFAVLTVNIFQSYIALCYPPPPCEPLKSQPNLVQIRTPTPRRPLNESSPKLSRMKLSSTSPFSTPVSHPARMSKSLFSNSSPPFQMSSNSSFSSSITSSSPAHRSHKPHAPAVRSLRASLLNQLESADDDDF